MPHGTNWLPGPRAEKLKMGKTWFSVLAETHKLPDNSDETNAAAWGVPEKKVADLGLLVDRCAVRLAKLDDPDTDTAPARAECNAAFEEYVDLMQDLHSYFYLKDFPVEALSRLGLPQHDTTNTPHPAPTSQPDTDVLPTINHYEHLVRAMNHATGDTSKPSDAHGVCFAWQVGGEKPTKGEHLPKTKSQRRSSHIVAHDEEDKGKTAYYATCYTNDKGDRGTWSPVVEAVIA